MSRSSTPSTSDKEGTPTRPRICIRTGLTPATSASGLGSSRPHLHREWAHSGHICTGTGLSRCHRDRIHCDMEGAAFRIEVAKISLGIGRPVGRAESWCRCGRGGPSPGADVAELGPVPVQMWHGQRGAPCGRIMMIVAFVWLLLYYVRPMPSVPSLLPLGSPLPHPRRD